MSDEMAQTLSELRDLIVADGIVDANEVLKLRKRFYADGIIDRDEANFLFEVNDIVSGHTNDSSWKEFFVEALCAHLLRDPTTPGALDGPEAAWLLESLQRDGKLDENERALLDELKKQTTAMSEGLTALVRQD